MGRPSNNQIMKLQNNFQVIVMVDDDDADCDDDETGVSHFGTIPEFTLKVGTRRLLKTSKIQYL